MPFTTRRTLLAGLGATPLIGFGGAAHAAGPLRTRQPISSLKPNDPDLEALRLAIPRLRKSGAWDRQVAIHADMSLRHHSSWRFLPWHRLQLAWFEKLVARASGKADFALPYWDWDDDQIPQLMFDEAVFALPGREARPHETITGFLRRNNQRFTSRLTDPFNVFFGRARPDFAAPDGGRKRYYSGSCEWSGHNMIHGFVGGDMGRLDKSPNDPLFWMHHANIDRLWWFWSQKHGAGSYPKAWLNEPLSAFVDPDGTAVAPVTAAATVDPAAFGYTYPYDASPPMVGAGAPRKAMPQKDYAWAMTRLAPNKGVIDIPPGIADAWHAKATGYIDVIPDPHACGILRLTAHAKADDQPVFEDAVFMVPMGHAMGKLGHTVDLSRVWGVAGAQGLRLIAETGPLKGRRSSDKPALLASFIVDARASFPR